MAGGLSNAADCRVDRKRQSTISAAGRNSTSKLFVSRWQRAPAGHRARTT